MRLDEDTKFDYSSMHKNYTPIHPATGNVQANLNLAGVLDFVFNNESKFYNLSDPETGFFVKIGFITQSNNPLQNDRNANITLSNGWFGYLFSQANFQLGSTDLESINDPGVVMEILDHLKPEDYRSKGGEDFCFIPDSSSTTINRIRVGTHRAVAQADPGDNVAATIGTSVNLAANLAATNTIAAVNAALTDLNEGFARRYKKYNYTVVDDGSVRYVEAFIPLSQIFGCCCEQKLLTAINFQIRLTRQGPTLHNELFYGDAQTGVVFANGNNNTGLLSLTLQLVDYTPNPEIVPMLRSIYSSKKINWTFRKRFLDKRRTNDITYTWSTTKQEVPQYVLIIAKGTTGEAKQDGSVQANYSLCRHANIQNVTIDLDGVRYPDIEQNSDFLNNQYSKFYQHFRRICNLESGCEPAITSTEYRDLFTIFAIDTSLKEKKAPNSVSNMSVTIKRREPLPRDNTLANTSNGRNPLDIEFFFITMNEKSFDIDCVQKTVINAAS